MSLTLELFEQVLLALLRQGGHSERRREPRIPITGLVLLTPDGADDPPIQARLTDISRGGAGLTHHAALRQGSRLIIHLPLPDADPQPVRCEVRHCDLIRESSYFIGVAFVE
jgi:c-di-GMP-binding flagellar brake protein YcgR